MRNRYLDLLRAAAIVRVIVYHLFGWPWLSIALPAMGIMFALAGSLVAGSLDKRPAGQVVVSRLRRLLPPMWLLGLIAVPVMLVAGWAQESDGDHPFSLPGLALWILPIADPPGSDKGIDVWEPLWYIRAYLWFVLLSPLLYPLYRRLGWFAVAAPIALLAVLDLTGFELPETADAELWDFVTYGACWIAGFAHHDGRLARIKPWVLVPVAAVLGATALYWLSGHQGEDLWDLNDVSESQALWSLAFVLLALRWQPPMGWLARAKPLDGAVTLLNARAVTVYLWHNIAIAAVWPVLTVLALDDLGAQMEGITEFAVALALTLFAVVAFGWAEDLAAKRPPRLWPTRTSTSRPTAGDASVTPTPDSPAPLLSETETVPGRPTAGHGIGRRTGAAAAMSTPRNWPPHGPGAGVPPPAWPPVAGPRGHAEPVGEFASGWRDPGPPAARYSVDDETRDLGFRVAGRRADPRGGDPRGGDPRGGDPRGGDPRGGDPMRAEQPPAAPLPREAPPDEAVTGEAVAGEAVTGEAVTGEVLEPGRPTDDGTPEWFLHSRDGRS